MKKAIVIGIISIIFLMDVIPLTVSSAHAMDGCWDGGSYGGYWEDPGWSWYGERRAVRTPQEVVRILHGYFSQRNIKIGKIREKELFFEADILDRNNVLIDIVIVNKMTGRIRSIY